MFSSFKLFTKNNYDVKIIEKSSKIGGACTFDKIKN